MVLLGGWFLTFQGIWCLHLQGQEVKGTMEDEGSTFLYNLQNHVPSDTPLRPRPRGPESLETPL